MNEFPKRFLWGISMAAFQYEMGVSQNALDPNSDWYLWVHDSKNIDSKIVSGDFPEHGPGYWDLYKKDHDWAEWMRLNTWRMNPEWSRIFPKPTTGVRVSVDHDDEGIKDIEVSGSALRKLDELANKSAVKRYGEIFRDVKSRGMNLILNLYHWPLPTWVHDPIQARDTGLREGPRGWVDDETVVEFAKFAAYVAWKFPDIPDMWSTMNEPSNVWSLGYLGGSFPPGLMDLKAAERAAFNMVQAHARAYDQIKRVVGKNARVGVIYIVSPGEPLIDSEQDREAVRLYHKASVEWFFKSILQGIVKRNLDGGEINRRDMRNRADWIGVNYYTRSVIKHIDRPPYFQSEADYGFSCKPSSGSVAGRPTSEFGWEIYPEGMRKALNICGKYGKPLMVTENGIADIKDKHRPWYLVSHLYNVWLAIKEDKLNIIGYLHWSLIDNFEWAMGFSKRFGLIHVDMNTKKRTPRPSAYIYRDIIENNALPEYLEEYSKYPNVFC